MFLRYVIHEFACCHMFCFVDPDQMCKSFDQDLMIGFMWRFCTLATSSVNLINHLLRYTINLYAKQQHDSAGRLGKSFIITCHYHAADFLTCKTAYFREFSFGFSFMHAKHM